jgi:hypothetical protein
MRLPKSMAAIQARDYVRVKDRTDKHDAPLPPSNGTDDPFGDMDDAPF